VESVPFIVETEARGTYDITERVRDVVARSGVRAGLATVFIHHTSASLIICENADPGVRRDLEAFAARLVPDGDALFEHDDEGPDDMPAHIRMALTRTSETIPIVSGELQLGTWQGIFLFEHRRASHTRHIELTLIGE